MSAIAVAFAVLPISQGITQTLPACQSATSDSDGDGFGWENNASCIASTSPSNNNVGSALGQCEDRGGFPWGWNPVTLESCRLDMEPVDDTSAGACIDTDPVGDGWGWNGITSCQLEVTAPVCVDSPPVGDGWGWDGITSCVIENTVATDLDNIPNPIEQLTRSTSISPREFLNVPLSCRRVRWLEQFEINEPFDRLAVEQDLSRIFYTATFQQDPLNGSFSIEGSWDDIYMSPVSLSWDMSTNDVRYGPEPNGTLNFHMVDQFIAIDQVQSAGSSGDIVEFIISYCLTQ